MNDENERVERGGARLDITLRDDAGADVTKVNVKDNGTPSLSLVILSRIDV